MASRRQRGASEAGLATQAPSFPLPYTTVDVVIFSVIDDALMVQLVQRLIDQAGDELPVGSTGEVVGHTLVGPLRIPVRVRLGEPPAATVLAATPVPTADGSLLELEHLATIEGLRTASLVNHDDAQRRVVVGFNVRGAALGEVVSDLQAGPAAEVPLPRGVRMVWGGQYASLEEARARLALVIPAALLAIVAVLFALFGRLRPALIVLTHVPFACIGGILALTMRALPLSLSAAIGFIALSGIAVLNGVVLVARIGGVRRGFVADQPAAHP